MIFVALNPIFAVTTDGKHFFKASIYIIAGREYTVNQRVLLPLLRVLGLFKTGNGLGGQEKLM